VMISLIAFGVKYRVRWRGVMQCGGGEAALRTGKLSVYSPGSGAI